jgi:ATP-dependent Clp protease ATP-binding subunit ClpC
MFERFTERARKVVVFAQEEAGRFGHNYIGAEHVLLSLVRESEGVAVRVHSNLDVDPDKVRQELLLTLGEEPGQDPLGVDRRCPGAGGEPDAFPGAGGGARGWCARRGAGPGLARGPGLRVRGARYRKIL